MGYEVQLFLGERRRFDGEEERKDYFGVVATIDLCVPSDEIKRLCDTPDGDPVYMYGPDGNTRIVEDSYGHELSAIPAERVLALIKKANVGSGYPNGYRRYNMAIPLLESFIASGFKNAGVVLYGH